MPSNVESQGNPIGPHDDGIICDGCDKFVHGLCYKCIQCADYDLCLKCAGCGMHPKHCMIRLPVPIQWNSPYGRRLVNQINSFVKKAHSQATEEKVQKQCPYKTGKRRVKSRHCEPTGEAGVSSSCIEEQPTQAEENTFPEIVCKNEPGWSLNRGESPTLSISSPSTSAVPQQVQPSAPVEASSTSIYSTLPPPPVVKPESTIEKAVETMLQMGFTNEGGWLTNFLVSKNGDIAAALDALSPLRR